MSNRISNIGSANNGYGLAAKAFHWLIVLLLTLQYSVGWLMPHIGRNTPNEGLVSWHLSIGAAVLFVIMSRLGWRLFFPVTSDAPLAPWERTVSRVTHAMLYILVLAMTVLGWAAADYHAWDVRLFGLVSLPAIAPEGASWAHTAGDVHNALLWVLLAFIVLHAAGALYHYFVKRDQVLQRILP
jgi:cytochrome b561